jgi:arylsulfatase A-like enzyme
MRRPIRATAAVVLALLGNATASVAVAQSPRRPNVVLIYADDLGYGDVSSYGATRVRTPNIDALAARGVRFTNAHAPAATCTPSRYALLTGEYAWRREGTGIAPGDAPALIRPGRTTLASVLKAAGYATGVVGKWHLGLGPEGGPDWNGEIRPGPLEIGFDEAFLIPATPDRVPTVYVRDHRVVGLDPADPIRVSYREPIGDEPTGREHPELLRVKPSHGHDQTIVDGISRIGYMSGGRAAWWDDAEISSVLTRRAVDFIERHRDGPFFLYFAPHDVHVPRAPNERFVGKSGMGPRGDAIVELDWSVGEIVRTLARLGLAESTLVIFTSDNGPVVDDGYRDRAVELLGGHAPAGPLRGGKYSIFEGGTRVPMIVCWPGRVAAGTTSAALVSQVDYLASLASLAGVPLPDDAAPDSRDLLSALLGRSASGRDELVEQAGTLALLRGRWKYIEPGNGRRVNAQTNTELGNDPAPQLYDLGTDLGERHDVAADHPEVVREMAARLQRIRSDGHSRP